jgi:regulatory protein
MQDLPKPLQEIYVKLAKYCAYQERCTHEIHEYLKKYGLSKEDEYILTQKLEQDKFLDDKRFAVQFAKGKFHLKKWGKIKIRYELRQKYLSEEHIQNALEHIPDEEYYAVLTTLIEKSGYDTKNYTQKAKLLRYLQGKGYEYDEIRQVLQNIDED